MSRGTSKVEDNRDYIQNDEINIEANINRSPSKSDLDESEGGCLVDSISQSMDMSESFSSRIAGRLSLSSIGSDNS